MLDEVSPRLDEIEAMAPGGRLDFGFIGTPEHLGVGASLEHRVLSPDLSMFGEFEARYGRAHKRWDWQAQAGLRLRW